MSCLPIRTVSDLCMSFKMRLSAVYRNVCLWTWHLLFKHISKQKLHVSSQLTDLFHKLMASLSCTNAQSQWKCWKISAPNRPLACKAILKNMQQQHDGLEQNEKLFLHFLKSSEPSQSLHATSKIKPHHVAIRHFSCHPKSEFSSGS